MSMLHNPTCSSDAPLFNQIYHKAYQEVTDYLSQGLLYVLKRADCLQVNVPFTANEIIEKTGCISAHQPHLRWTLYFLMKQGLLARYGTGKYILKSYPVYMQQDYTTIHINIEPSLELIDYILERWLSFLKGEDNPMYLIGSTGTQLWANYYSNAHDLYSVYNQWAAESLVDEMEKHKMKANILEIGSGFGSAAHALAAECLLRGKNFASYLITDVSQILADSTRKKLDQAYPHMVFKSCKLDMNHIPELGTFDFVYAVNALHYANDVSKVLLNLKKLLKRGGCLILSECVRANYSERLHQEFMLSLLPDFPDVRSEESQSPCFGFRTADEWREMLIDAGYLDVELEINDSEFVRGAILKGLA